MIKSYARNPWIITLAVALVFYVLLSYWASQIEAARIVLKYDIQQLSHSSLQRTKNVAASVVPVYEDTYLASILFVDEDRWTVWINGQTLRAGEKYDLHGFTLISVSGDEVILGHEGTRIQLQPNQTYWPEKGKVLNGDRRRSKMFVGEEV